MHRAPGERGKKKNELIKLLVQGGGDDGDALSLATCMHSEKRGNPWQSNSASGVKNGLTGLFYGAINMTPLNAFCAFSCRSPGRRNPAPNNKALSD